MTRWLLDLVVPRLVVAAGSLRPLVGHHSWEPPTVANPAVRNWWTTPGDAVRSSWGVPPR